MKAGKLNNRIEILQRVKRQDESGAVVFRWEVCRRLWADVRHVSGVETMRHDVLNASRRASMRVRYKAGITPDMRVRCAAGLYAIKAVLPDMQQRAFLDLVCESLPNEDDCGC